MDWANTRIIINDKKIKLIGEYDSDAVGGLVNIILKKPPKEKSELSYYLGTSYNSLAEHTGDFFGHYFYLIMDFMSLGIVIVTLTGVYLWYKFRRLKQSSKG